MKRLLALSCLGALLAACQAAGSTAATDEPAGATAPGAVAQLAALDLERPLVRYYEIADTWPFCQKIVAVVDELRGAYEGRVDFEVVSPEETAKARDELVRYNLVSRGHGLVAFNGQGEVVFSVAGHQFGREIVEAAAQQAAP